MFYFNFIELLGAPTTDSLQQCLADFQMLQKLITEKDNKSGDNPTEQLAVLELRNWLLHSSVFLFLHELNAKDDSSQTTQFLNAFLEFFCEEKHLSCIQMSCPWLLRYLATAIVLKKNSNKYFWRTVMRAIKQESYQYNDCFTTFLTSLLDEADFEKAMTLLRQAEAVMDQDIFLKPWKKTFLQNARVLFFETYCKVHSSLDVNWVGEQIGLDHSEAEKWVVNLMRSSKLDAKIDSEKGKIYMSHKVPNPYQQTIDLTKDLAFRTYRLVTELS